MQPEDPTHIQLHQRCHKHLKLKRDHYLRNMMPMQYLKNKSHPQEGSLFLKKGQD